ncbi:MAG: hypothetical protein NTY67_01635 [Cyanobacteria bacterium]|nr:hypothetical protein [Cyanobacteriota bacterium]
MLTFERTSFFKMKISQRFAVTALMGTGIALSQLVSPAGAATFNLTSGPSGNQSIKSYLDNSSTITLEAFGSNSTGNNALTINGPGNFAPLGLCAFAVVAGSIGRCGYGNVSGNGVSSFQLKFDKAVSIKAFDVSAFSGISVGSVDFSLNNSTFITTNFVAAGSQTLASKFSVGANQPVFVRTSGILDSIGEGQGALVRLGSLTTTEQVPAPLPILGAAIGFRFSRRIRKRIGATSLQA